MLQSLQYHVNTLEEHLCFALVHRILLIKYYNYIQEDSLHLENNDALEKKHRISSKAPLATVTGRFSWPWTLLKAEYISVRT